MLVNILYAPAKVLTAVQLYYTVIPENVVSEEL